MLQFSGALNPAQAQSLAPHHLLSGKVKKSHTTYSKPVPFVLVYVQSLGAYRDTHPQGQTQPGSARGAADRRLIADRYLRPSLDGNHDGQPGGDFVANLSKNKVTILIATSAKAVPRTAAAAVDHLLQESSFAASAAIRRRRHSGGRWSNSR